VVDLVDTLFIHWYDNSEKKRAQQERDASLRDAIKMLDAAPPGVRLRVIVEASEMSLWFVTTNLQEWLSRLCQTRGWRQIETTMVVVSSTVVRNLVKMFPTEKTMHFVKDVDEACEKLGVDPDILM